MSTCVEVFHYWYLFSLIFDFRSVFNLSIVILGCSSFYVSTIDILESNFWLGAGVNRAIAYVLNVFYILIIFRIFGDCNLSILSFAFNSQHYENDNKNEDG